MNYDLDVGLLYHFRTDRTKAQPYLRPFVVARINPIRFSTSTEFDFDDVMGRMQKNAAKFNVDRIRQEDIVRAGGGPSDDAA